MQRRHPNRSRDMRGPANWQERNERAYWGSDESDLPHYDDLLLPDDERDIDYHDARGRMPGERLDERRWRGERAPAYADERGSRERRDAREFQESREAGAVLDERGVDGPRGGYDERATGRPREPAYGGPGRASRREPGDDRERAGRDDWGGERGERRPGGYVDHDGHGAPSYARYDPPPMHHARERSRGTAAPRLRGPKGYVRSDERIREDVCERLAYAIDIDVSDVSVLVKDACVQLDGTVPERWMKHEVEDLADSCVWVRDVDNRVRVARVASDDAPYPVPRPDLDAAPPTPPVSPAPGARPSGAIGPSSPAEPDAATTGAAEPDRAGGARRNERRH